MVKKVTRPPRISVLTLEPRSEILKNRSRAPRGPACVAEEVMDAHGATTSAGTSPPPTLRTAASAIPALCRERAFDQWPEHVSGHISVLSDRLRLRAGLL